jgi:uncharacterized protein YjbI with pentapeptide repeats/transcriptional regulator with XRE-family HTH domain
MYKPKEAKLFGVALKRLLDEKGLSDRQFAKQAGLEQSYVSKLLNPKPGKEIAEPRKKTRQQLAQGLGITEQELQEQIARYSDSEAEKTISAPPGLAESEEASAKPHQESVESDPGSIEARYFRATSNFDSLEPLERKSRIQVLEEIAIDSPRYHWKVIEFLADFVRRKAPRKEEDEWEEERSPIIPDDIQAALTVIGRRNPDNDKKSLNLRNTNLRGANLFGADLQGAYLNGADLREVCLTTANLKGAVLWEANLEGAKLDIANLEEAKLSKRKTNLQSVNFSCSILRRADLSEAELQQANLSGADLRKADLTGANLERAYLYGANLQEASLMRTKGQRADFRRAYFRGTNLSGADFSRAKNVELDQLKLAHGDRTTSLPDELKDFKEEILALWKQSE